MLRCDGVRRSFAKRHEYRHLFGPSVFAYVAACCLSGRLSVFSVAVIACFRPVDCRPAVRCAFVGCVHKLCVAVACEIACLCKRMTVDVTHLSSLSA